MTFAGRVSWNWTRSVLNAVKPGPKLSATPRVICAIAAVFWAAALVAAVLSTRVESIVAAFIVIASFPRARGYITEHAPLWQRCPRRSAQRGKVHVAERTRGRALGNRLPQTAIHARHGRRAADEGRHAIHLHRLTRPARTRIPVT